MKKRFLAILMSLIFILISFSGCDGVSLMSAERLMRPPKAYKVNSEIKEAFEDYVASKNNLKGIILMPPSTGDYRSAFVMHDIDLDGEEEALVFYTTQEDSSGHLNIMDYENGKWVTVEDFSIAGNNINFVRFVQMNPNTCPAIIVSHNIYESDTNKAIAVYACDNKGKKIKVKHVCSELYSVMENVDIDSDGSLDIFLIQQDFSDTNRPQAYAYAFKMLEDNTIEKFGSAKLDGTISAYVGVKAEKASSSSPMRIYVDAIKGEQQMITEVVYWNAVSNKLVTPMFDVETQSNIITRRSEGLKSQDFDGDGVIEIPSQKPLEASRKYMTNEKFFQQMYITDWIEIENETEYTLTSTVVNARDSYVVYYDDMKKLIGGFTVYDYGKENKWTFREYDAKTRKTGKEIFSITSVAKKDEKSKNINEKYYLREDDNFILYFTPTQLSNQMKIKAQDIKECLKTFKE